MLKYAPGVWRKCELYKIKKSLIVFEKNNILLKTVLWKTVLTLYIIVEYMEKATRGIFKY